VPPKDPKKIIPPAKLNVVWMDSFKSLTGIADPDQHAAPISPAGDSAAMKAEGLVTNTSEDDTSSSLSSTEGSEPSLLVPLFVSAPSKAEPVGEPTGVDYALFVNKNGVLVPQDQGEEEHTRAHQ